MNKDQESLDKSASKHIETVKNKIEDAEKEATKIYGEGNYIIELLTP